jgi:acetylornithine deacetylase/succinyl-diaminopimelate desuccinylase-like protein
MPDPLTGEVTELLQQLIRNRCVNDGTPESGQEYRSAEVLRAYLEGAGLELETHESLPGRRSLVARIDGRDPAAPSLLLLGHTDVVPVSPEGWREDPFGAELIHGEVWGRGAVDMLNLTSSMAVAVRRLAAGGWRPRGTLVFVAVADEESGGALGAEWLSTHHPELVRCDHVLTESGGIPRETAGGTRLDVAVGEKGIRWCRLRVRGTPGHGSRPWRSDNALVKAARVVTRLAELRPEPQVHDVWRSYVEGMGFAPDVADALVDPERVGQALLELPADVASFAHACTHTTISPNVARGGTKTNVIPDLVELEIDVRTLPGQTAADVERLLADALGDLAEEVEVGIIREAEATESPVDTALWESLARAAGALLPGATLVPSLFVGGTDARFFRRGGRTAYGFGLFSPRITPAQFSSMFHGNDERVDVDSLRLSAQLWEATARDLLG